MNQFIQLFSQLVVRTVFATSLGLEYVGLYAFLVSTVGIFSLAELGAAVAFSYLLYKPLAEEDHPQVARFVNWYGRFYRRVSVVVITGGVLSAPLVVLAVDSQIATTTILVAYLIFVTDLAVTYVFAQYRTLLIADQNERLVSRTTAVFTVLKTLAQIAVLALFSSFVWFLAIQLFTSVVISGVIAYSATRRYEFLRDYVGVLPSTAERKELWVRLRAMFLHRFGSTVSSSADNIVLAVITNLQVVGGLANYKLLIASADKFLGAFYSALSASVGNLTAGGSRDHTYFVFRVVTLVHWWISLIVFTMFVTTSTLVVEVWLGSTFVIDDQLMVWVGINFFFRALRRPVNSFKTAYGLFVRDRFRPLVEAGVSILTSIILVYLIGPVGVLIGSFVGYALINSWLEPLILFRHGFTRPVFPYFLYLFGVTGLAAVATVMSRIFVNLLPGLDTLPTMALAMVISGVISIILPFVVVFRSLEFQEICRTAGKLLRVRKKRA